MRFGAVIFPTDYSIAMTEVAPAVEAAGFESLWVAEHSHMPASRESPWAGGAELPKHYWHTLDPFVALTAAAVVTSRLLIGTAICLVVQRDPIHTAKEVASLDHVSGGRFLFGIGGGWNREEMADHGTRFATRWKLMRERVELMKALWTQDEAEYHGEMVDLPRSWAWPKPVQKPHPPVILGGSGPRILERVVRYGDGWMPNRGVVLERIPELARLAAAAGRDSIPVTTYPRADAADLEAHRAAGVERCLFYLPADGRDAALSRLELLSELVRPFTDGA